MFFMFEIYEKTFTPGEASPPVCLHFRKDITHCLQQTSRVIVGRKGFHGEAIKAWSLHGTEVSSIFSCIFAIAATVTRYTIKDNDLMPLQVIFVPNDIILNAIKERTM